jgi:putative ABC transport system permease protein
MPPQSGEVYSFVLLRFSLHMSDLLVALRSLVRTPSFTAVVVLVLALGIGANTAIFSVVDAALLKPMPIPEPARVVRLSRYLGPSQSFVWFNRRGFEVWPAFAHARSFDAVGAYATGEFTLLGYNRGRLRTAAVTPEVFEVFKVAPQIGRVFTKEDVTRGSFQLAVISHELCQTHFGGDTNVLGRQILLNRQTFTVLGVMPRGFDMPQATQVWVPSHWGGQVVGGGPTLPTVIARMARGVKRNEAVQEISRMPGPMNSGTLKDPSRISITPLRDTLVGELRAIILLLAAGAFIVLLVASTNIASLLLTRVSAHSGNSLYVARLAHQTATSAAKYLARRFSSREWLLLRPCLSRCGRSTQFARGCRSECMALPTSRSMNVLSSPR